MAALMSPFILLFLIVTMETKHLPQRDDRQVLKSLFGIRLSSLILAPPTFDDLTEGSAGNLAPIGPSPKGSAKGLAQRKQGAVPGFLYDVIHQVKMGRSRNRKWMVGRVGRGCFGMKMDRIGSVSGLGC